MSAADDLSGGWDGIYNYPRGHRPNAFAATLRDSHGLLAGEISEPSQEPHDRGAILHALLEGSREGSAVRFVKTYDDPSRAHYAIFYSGTVNGEGTEITGRWDIPGVWSGTFIMGGRSATKSRPRQRLPKLSVRPSILVTTAARRRFRRVPQP